MKKRIYSAILATLMMLNLLPISALANTGEVCAHEHTVQLKLEESICKEDCTYPKGVGELYLCTDCGELVHGGNWTGNAYSPADVSMDAENENVTLCCSFCGAEKTFSLNEEHTHDWDDGTVTLEPSCTEAGEKTYTCTTCGETKTEEVVALGHNWDEWTVTEKPTLSAPGIQERTCERGCVETREISPIGHDVNEEYEPLAGRQSFDACWNDNGESENRTATDDFLAASHAVLHYEIVSEDGTVMISGVLENAAEANATFDFLSVELEEDAQLLNVGQAAAVYTLSTNSDLPVGYDATYTDYATGESTVSEFKINYTLTLKNPAPDAYVTTLPERTQDEVTLKDGDKVIFTKLTDWCATVVWYDDDNRSALGGTSTEYRPRVSADDLKNATEVYCYTRGYNVQEGDLVEGDYGYEIDGDTIRLTDLPAYDNEGNQLIYYIKQAEVPAANADYVPGNHYTSEYLNVGNVAAKTNGVYDGGTLYETLKNTVPFSVSKKWADGKTPAERPNCKFYIWRITEDYNNGELAIDPEFCYAIPDCYDSYDVPKENTDDYEFVRDMGDEGQTTLFPMYDTEGHRYIYFGKERGLTGDYSTVLDNSEANVPDSVKDVFNEEANAGYFLNGATIVNTVGERKAMPISKDFHALSLQNKLSKDMPIKATFLLQKKDAAGNWVNADADADRVAYTEKNGVIAEKGSDSSFSVTLTDFTAEDMSDSYGGVTVGRYDSEYNMKEYRWVETGVSVNGVRASYQPDKWVSDDDGNMHYEGDIIVNDGQTSTVLGDAASRTSGPDDTTAIFEAVASGSAFTNTLVGKQQVNIRKYFKDENGNNIAADPVRMGDVEISFAVYRDGEKIDTITMTIDDLSESHDYWEALRNYDRYDEEGRECRFKIVETNVSGEWSSSENYNVQVVEDPADSGILVKRMQTVCVNSLAPGDGLGFDVEKQWLDDSDLQTRNPIVAAVYRFRDADGVLLSIPELIRDDITLSVDNNWYQKFEIPAIHSATKKDSAENYVILEKGILVDGKLVETDYDFDLTSAQLKNIHDAIRGGKTYAGITGSTEHENNRWDKLCYRYKLFESRSAEDATTPVASYVLTNLRIGTQNYEVEKTWKAGGQIRKCSFGLFYGNHKLAEFTLDVVDGHAKLSDVDWRDAACKVAYEKGDIVIKAISTGKDASGNYKAAVKIEGLDKFDDKGAQKEYAIEEIAIYGTDGTRYDVLNGSCKAGEETFAVGISTDVVYADNETHRAPDLHTVKVTNTRVGKYDLVSNKVWRDANQTPRPDVCFTIYRMSTQDTRLRSYVESSNTAKMSEYLSAHIGKEYRISADRYWDTRINRYWWTCTVKDMQQYDSEGYPYVYYAVERIGNARADEESGENKALYQGYYCNYTADESGYRPTNPTGTKLTTQKVFGVKNDELCSAKGNVFILSDGTHKAPGGGYKDYYSATAVNRPERDRTVSGKKLWKLPQGWSIPREELPEVQVDLYRTTKEISFSDYSTTAAYVAAIKNAATEGVVSSIAASEKLNKYTYTFDKDSKGNLPRYDEWGSTYYYYTLENPQWEDRVDHQNFPESAIVYEDNDFSINNVFTSRPPYVEVGVEKTWELSDDVLGKLAEYGLSSITTDDFAPATIALYGIPTDKKDKEINKSKFDFGKVTLTPGVTDSDGNGEDDTVYTVNGNKLTATYTFKDFYNSETRQRERLPFYWLNDYQVHFYLKETVVNGYKASYSTERVNFDGEQYKGDLHIFYNSNRFELTNTYTGIENELTKFEFSKVWDDKYVDNEAYRPASVTFTVKRSVDGKVDSGFVKTVTLNKADFAGKDTWKGTLSNLLKYAPSGKAYVYFVDSEKLGSDVADAVGDNIGNYTLSNKSDSRLTNTMRKDLRVTVEATKKWTVDGAAISSYADNDNTGFDDLRKMGVIPDSVQFVVQRSNGGAYQYVPASSYLDSTHKTTIGDQAVLGREINLKTATANNYAQLLSAKMKWENLPTKDMEGASYTYRVIEILRWHDGTTDTMISGTTRADRGMSSTISSKDNVFTLTNDLETKKVRIAKIWDDENGAENTRPDKIDVTVKPVGNASGKTFTLTATGNAMDKTDANVYYSAYFHIPAGIAMTYGVSGEKYTISESFTARHKETYTQTITSDGGNVKELPDGTYAMQLTNTYTAERKTLHLEATKVWSGDEAWKDVTRPDISFKIQYRDRTTGKWTDITDMSQFSKDATQPATKTVPADGKVTWTNMFKYWHPVTIDGKAEYIRYQVVEVVNTDSGNASYSKNGPEFKSISDSTTTAKATVTNTLETKTVEISKSWTKNGNASDKLTGDEVKKLVALNAIPNELTFAIEYQLRGTSTWTTIPNGTVTYTAEQLLAAMDTGKKLPRYDKDGNEITYRVRETAVKYSNGKSYDVVWSGDSGKIGSIFTTPQTITFADHKAAMVNDYQYVSLDITKVWKDEGNRDGLRKDIAVTLQRDGANYSVVSTSASHSDSFCTVTKNDDTWAIGWKYLPKYQAGKEPADANKSVYTWEETTGVDGYTVTYDANGATRREADNNHQPMRGTVVAAKNWSDNDNKFTSRPDVIYLKLQYKAESGAWQDVTTNTLVNVNGKQLYKDADAAKVYTTSADGWRSATAAGNWRLNWANLPVKTWNGSTSATVAYRVIEGIKGADGSITVLASGDKLSSYTVTYSNVSLSLSGDSDEKTATVTNAMATTTLDISKSWSGDSAYTNKVRPVSVTFHVEWKKTTESNWHAVADGVCDKLTCADGVSAVTLSATDGWHTTLSGLPRTDAAGTAYQYRVTEAKITYADGDVLASGDKSLAGPYDVTNVTVDAAYADGKYTATAENSLLTGKLSVTKKWMDEDNRDGGRQPITVELYRDGVKLDEKTVSAADGWTAEFTGLPVYKNTASGELTADKSLNDVKSVYTVKEKGETDGIYTGKNDISYTVSYSVGVKLAQAVDSADYTGAATITNTRDVFKGSLTVSKVWDDAENRFDSRPAEITLTLQYKSGDSWIDVTRLRGGEATPNVYTNDANPGKIRNTGSYTWTGLPVNLDDKTVTYRVVETDVSGYVTAVYAPSTVQLTKTGSTYHADIVITNAADTTSLTIHKDWESVSYLTPVSANFLVEYSHGDSGWRSYGNVTVNYDAATSDGETTVSGLPKTDGEGNSYTYRVSEVSATYHIPDDGTITVNAAGSFDDSNAWSGNVGIYVATVDGSVNENGSRAFNAVNEVVKGSLCVTKTWEDDNDRDGGRQSIVVELYRDGVKFAEKTISAADEWTAVFNELPVYQNTASGSTSAKSVYTLKEKGLNEDGEYVGNNDRLYTVDIADGVSLEQNEVGDYAAESSVTNSHDPLHFSVKAMKEWDDSKDYGIRPDVQLELRWATDPAAADWTAVAKSDTAPADGTGKTVTTTSPVRQTLKNEEQTIDSTWGSAQWDNLPAYVIAEQDGVETSVPVYYKAFEVGEIPASYVSTESAAVSYTNAMGDDMIAAVQVINTLDGRMGVTAQKTWLDDSEKYNSHADSITVKLQYVTSDTDTEWKDVPVDGTQVLSADNVIPWSYTWENLRNDYSYRVIEVSMAFGAAVLDTIPAGSSAGEIGGYTYTAEANVNAEGAMTQCNITNELIVGKIAVTKTWNDSHDRDGIRPETLTFQLFRDDGTEPIATQTVNVTASGIEECVFGNIPVYQEGTRELSRYYVVETDEDGYSISYDVTVDGAVSLSDEVGDVTTVTDQTVSVTNTHETTLLRVEATKTWDDANDPYGLRPNEVSLKLQYAFSPDSEEWTDVTVVTEVPDPAEEDGTLVFTTSELIQTLTSEDQLKGDANVWGIAAWENLPAYALMQVTDGEDVSYRSMPVYYRVVESEKAAISYGTTATESMCCDDATGEDMTAIGTVVNTLQNHAELTVTKTWIGDKPDVQVAAQLQYRKDMSEQWMPVPKNAEVTLSDSNDWTCTFTDLRADYEYRCVELGLLHHGKLIQVSDLHDDNGAVCGVVLSYNSISETSRTKCVDGDTYYVTELVNTYVPDSSHDDYEPGENDSGNDPDEPNDGPDTGDTYNGMLYGAGVLTSAVGIAVLVVRRKKKEDA